MRKQWQAFVIIRTCTKCLAILLFDMMCKEHLVHAASPAKRIVPIGIVDEGVIEIPPQQADHTPAKASSFD